MWIKFLLCGLIIVFCTLLGYFAAERSRSRKRFYLQFSSFNESYLGELAYTRKPLEPFLDQYGYRGDFGKLLKAVREHRKPVVKLGFLTAEERTETVEYLSMLGRGDTASQSGYFASRREPLASKRESSAKEAKQRGELCVKLGLLAGLAFVILIV